MAAASLSVVRSNGSLNDNRTLIWRPMPQGIPRGAFIAKFKNLPCAKAPLTIPGNHFPEADVSSVVCLHPKPCEKSSLVAKFSQLRHRHFRLPDFLRPQLHERLDVRSLGIEFLRS